MNKLLAGLAAFAIATLTSQAVLAQAWYGHRPPPSYGYGPRPVLYPHPYGPPAYGYRAFREAPPRCFTRMDSYWNGWRWAQRPVRICR